MINDYDLLPCSNDENARCSTCALHGNGCPVEMPYDVVKAVYSVKTTPKPGVNVRELVKAKFPKQYKLLESILNWDDLDGVLDLLYGVNELLGIDVSDLIEFIESNCEVQQ